MKKFHVIQNVTSDENTAKEENERENLMKEISLLSKGKVNGGGYCTLYKLLLEK